MLLVTASDKYNRNQGTFLFIELDGSGSISIVVSAVTWICRKLVPGNKLLAIVKMLVHAYDISFVCPKTGNLSAPFTAARCFRLHSLTLQGCVFSTKSGTIW